MGDAPFAIWSRTKRSGDRSRASDRGSRTVLMILLWIGLGLDFSLSFLLPQAAFVWQRTTIFLGGIGLMLAGMAFRYYAVTTLGRFFCGWPKRYLLSAKS